MPDQQPSWTLVIHGGAGVLERSRMTPELDAQHRAGLDAALQAGASLLAEGGSALDAVEAAARSLEDNELFNAGRGAVLTYDGTTELDAAIMDGRERDAGAVTGVSATRNPISLARAVMEKSPHVFLGGKGADQFAQEQGIEQAGRDYFDLPLRRKQLEELKAMGADWFDVDMKFGTIGAVARDVNGHVAAATSTGGITGKRWGRIGDSPVIGSGTWADDRSCAVSATGSGEFFIRAAVAHEIAARMRYLGEDAQAAADAVIADVGALGGDGGVIVVTPAGEPVFSFNSDGMYRGFATPSGRTVAIYGDE
ncbi:MAG TPA: isoaspartyl peptidase/L-asparaginase [Allosphingosinicella sp.]|jgi:beta-aspartyl-peptidase (threonine type)|uniref:isoaspartyl peptidase/L-asparaginase family protein n=1 Tax=Allosphingosinicella sp. TaxID=2823234 RepID=UPI002F29018D